MFADFSEEDVDDDEEDVDDGDDGSTVVYPQRDPFRPHDYPREKWLALSHSEKWKLARKIIKEGEDKMLKKKRKRRGGKIPRR